MRRRWRVLPSRLSARPGDPPCAPPESAQVTLGDALDANRALQKSAAIKLFAANNSALYVTLMERHLDYGTKMSESS